MANVADLKLSISADVSNATAGLDKVRQGLATTAMAAAKVDSSLQKTSTVTGQASQTFVNFGRVLQDAPYGFIGIANNLNPLLEGFQRLSANAKTAGVSIGSTLLSSLTGAGGIGLALSAVTAAVTFASIGFQAWTGRVKKSGEEVDVAAESAKKLKTAIDGINSSTAAELTKVKELVSGFEQENVSRRNKIGIINELKQINPEYFGQLNAEKTSIGELKTAYDNYNNSIVNSIKTKVFSQDLEGLVKKELELRKAIEGTSKFTSGGQIDISGVGGNDPRLKLYLDLKQSQERLIIDTDALNKNLAQQQGILDRINSLGGIDSLFKFSPEKAAKAAKAVDTVSEALVTLRKLNFPDTIAREVGDGIDTINKVLDKGPGFIVPLKFATKTSNEEADKLAEEILKQAEEIGSIVKSTLENAFISIGESLGGSGNFFSGVFQVIGDGLKQLGKYMITTFTIIGQIKTAINSLNPVLGVVAGIALIAIGTAISNGIPKLAAGGIVTRPTNALIGESGPEAVIPLGRVQGLLAGSDGGGEVVFYVHGQALRGVLKKADKSASRIN